MSRIPALSVEESDEVSQDDAGWISWFCALKGHEHLAEVEEDYIRDHFNLYGLRGQFASYDQSLEMILSTEAPEEEEFSDPEFLDIYRGAVDLYGLVHARYIVSPRGLQVMREKYLNGIFGCCPRVLCERQPVLPTGTSEALRMGFAKVFCPKCEQIYAPKSRSRELDGAYFGTSFPMVFSQSFPSLVPLDVPKPFVPRVFGFKLHKQKSIVARKLEADDN
mmetsp:Transcript_38357/g.90154  ORF Transcript_38357/g.90154 Transcript_38357/m.90154 type:complete len:221 (-) Transcript_38357:189-851(-)